MSAALSILALGLGIGMSLEAIPHAPESHFAFVAELERDAPAAVMALGADGLHVYPQDSTSAPWQVALGSEVSAFDLYDIDASGSLEGVWIAGAEVYGRTMTPEAEARLLFSIEPPSLPEGPFPLALIHDTPAGLRLIAPGEKQLLEYGLDGVLRASYPLDAQTSGHAMLGLPFRAWTPLQPMTGAADSLEILATRVQAFKPALEHLTMGLDPVLVSRRYPTPQQLLEASKEDSVYWPWFPLEHRPEDEAPLGAARVYYAADGVAGAGDSLVRLWDRAGASDSEGVEGPLVMGPERRYPGLVLPPVDSGPDFNGDGYTDLMTWRAPQPAPTADSLARALTRGAWTATLSVHLYQPESARFAPRAAARIEVALPINWFLSGLAPFQMLRTDDLTGDGKSELLFALNEDRLGLWRFTDDGLESVHEPGITAGEALQRHIATTPARGGLGGVALFAGVDRYWVLRMPAK